MAIPLQVVMEATLDQVDGWLRDGRISESVAEAYCDAWNDTPFRFTEARVFDGGIRTSPRR